MRSSQLIHVVPLAIGSLVSGEAVDMKGSGFSRID